MADTDVLKMKVADLKRELKMRGLPITGNKTELQERLQTALLDGDNFSLDDAAISEDLLDEDVLTDEDVEKAVLELPIDETSLLSPNPNNDVNNIASTGINLQEHNRSEITNVEKPKKIVILKRKSSHSIATSNFAQQPKAIEVQENLEISKEIDETNIKSRKIEFNNEKLNEANGEDKKNIKVTTLTNQERLELRAKKFGINSATSTSDGLTGKDKMETNMEDPKVIDALKKRAERFGCAVSPQIAQIENNEKLQKRKERFGLAISSGNTISNQNVNTNNIYAEKAKLRLERFQTQTTK